MNLQEVHIGEMNLRESTQVLIVTRDSGNDGINKQTRCDLRD